jgi:type IV pilus assembly protein PilM
MVRRIVRWLDALPHPMLACEISPQRIAAVRWTRGGRVHELAVEPIPPEALAASAVEPNIANAEVVGEAVKTVFQRLHAHDQDVALLVPDPVIRLFVQHFDEFPRSEQDAAPMLRWKLKKSVPFEAEETLVSYMRQEPRSQGVDVVVGLARLPIVREYEALAEAAGLRPGVVLTSALAAMALLEETRPALLARVCGSSLTTAVVRAGVLCGYRCTDLPVSADALQPAMLLEEVYPLAAYYQDHWQEGIGAVRLGGLGARVSEFVEPVRQELDCSVSSLVGSLEREGRLGADAEPLAEQELEGLLGWMQYRSVGEEREAA